MFPTLMTHLSPNQAVSIPNRPHYRIVLHSDSKIRGNDWRDLEYFIDTDEWNMSTDKWSMAVESFCILRRLNKDEPYSVYIEGMDQTNSYDTGSKKHSKLLFATDNSTYNNPLARDSLGIPFFDMGFLKSRGLRIVIKPIRSLNINDGKKFPLHYFTGDEDNCDYIMTLCIFPQI